MTRAEPQIQLRVRPGPEAQPRVARTAGKGDRAVKLTRSAAAIGAVVVLAGAAAAGCGSGGSSTSSRRARPRQPSWSCGAWARPSPSQVTWMNGVVKQFHAKFPAFKNTKVVVDWIPWGNRITDWTNALTSGKGGPDITELGNTDTPGIADAGRARQHHQRASSPGRTARRIIEGNLANDTVSGSTSPFRGSAACAASGTARTSSPRPASPPPPTTWAELLADAKLLRRSTQAPSASARRATSPTRSSASSGALAARSRCSRTASGWPS